MIDVVWDYTTGVIRRNSSLQQGQPSVKQLMFRHRLNVREVLSNYAKKRKDCNSY
ncbi:MAG: hypothetical protein ABSG53_22025 [Thermoguttaceae bacterium]